MGLLDSLRDALGMGAERDAIRGADPEDLFQLSTGYVTLATELDFAPAGEAALCFAPVDSTDFADARRDVADVLAVGELETGTVADFHEDAKGYSWVILADDDFEDLVTSVHFAADTFVEAGYGNRLLAALFAFERRDRVAYWIYSFRRGAFYPFVPRTDRAHERDSATEFKLETLLDGELDVEADEAYWYPLWPADPGAHPWE